MLTSDLALSWRRGRLTGPRYIDADDKSYLRMAEDLINIFRQHREQRRAELDEALEEYVGVGTDYKIVRGLIKLLTDRCVFESGSARDPFEIRRALFLKARSRHPVTHGADARRQAIADTAAELGCEPESVTENLYADLPENQRLLDFEDLTSQELLDRYNLAQAQALLYRSVEMQLRVEPQEPGMYRQLFDSIKAYRLIHTIRGNAAAGYEIKLSGPLSMFHRSQKYGVQMAIFLPALLLCSGWRMRAEIDMKSGDSAFFELDSKQNRLRTYYSVNASYENPLVDKLIAKWKSYGAEWSLERSGEVIDLGESAFIPDLVARNRDNKQVYLEILGFWTPRYLNERLKEFERWQSNSFLLAASEELRGSREAPSKLPPNVVLFKSSLDPDLVKSALDHLARKEN